MPNTNDTEFSEILDNIIAYEGGYVNDPDDRGQETIYGISKRVHPHGLRHTGAAEMAEEGVDIRVISRQLGHKNVAITHRYIDHLAPQAVLDAARGRHW